MRIKKVEWYQYIMIGLLLLIALLYLVCGESSVIAVHDNLDLFIPQFQMMKNTQTFFKHDVYAPFLGGISRDVLPSEFSLYTMLYMIMPSFAAYIVGYFVKIAIAVFSCVLLGKELLQEQYEEDKPLVWIVGFAYGLLNVFPTFGIPFASVPLMIYLILKIQRGGKWFWYIAVFLYPFVSYFSYFGLFILAYMVLYFLFLWIGKKKFPWRILLTIVVLSLGYVAFEYRLFSTMLLDNTITIRSSMEAGSYTLGEVLKTIGEGFAKGMFHAQSLHTYFILPLCILYIGWTVYRSVREKKLRNILRDPFYAVFLMIVFNSIIYGVYYFEPFRKFIETVLPPLTGWQFNRTIFFNPFLWYVELFIILKSLYEVHRPNVKRIANILAFAACFIILAAPTRYNDVYSTVFAKTYELCKGQKSETLSYEEFYSVDLFEKAKQDIGYCGQWSAAYGFYPATLEYNGISTVDGYLGFYSQRYKDFFREVIAPAIDRVPESREYFDSWGARAYLYSGTDVSIINGSRNYAVSDCNLYIDTDAFKNVGGRFIFSRIDISNAEEAGFKLIGTYTDDNSPYTLYVYETISRYLSRSVPEYTFEEMKEAGFDLEKIDALREELSEYAKIANEEKDAISSVGGEKDVIDVTLLSSYNPEAVSEKYKELSEEISKLQAAYAISDVVYYQNVYDTQMGNWNLELKEICVDEMDNWRVVIRELCNSPYETVMDELIGEDYVESYKNYEEITEEEKDLSVKETALTQEYNQAILEEYYYEYNGTEWDLASASNSYTEGMLDLDEYIEIYQGINEAKNAVCGEIFLELVHTRNEIAKINDYDNYAEYAYDCLYVRDYSLEEMKDLLKEIKKEVVPVVKKLDEKKDALDLNLMFDWDESDGKSRYAAIAPFLKEIDPELYDTYEHYERCGLYDVDASDSKGSAGFTTYIPQFRDAFVYSDSDCNYYDYYTAIHEFGHYNYYYHVEEDLLRNCSNPDVQEIHSQGLQMMMYEYYDELFDPGIAEVYSFLDVYDLTNGILNDALIAEFEIEVYENPDMTLDKLNRLYLKLSNSYGFFYNEAITKLYTWVDIVHLYVQPCYFVSYMTSSFTSLDLFTLTMTNRHEAIEKYMEITTFSSGAPYCAVVKFVGMRDIFQKGVSAQIISDVVDILTE